MTETKSTNELIDRYMGYSSDPKSVVFRSLVDLMVAEMIRSKIAPDELRDAAFVASIKFLQMHPMDLIYRRDDLPTKDTCKHGNYLYVCPICTAVGTKS